MRKLALAVNVACILAVAGLGVARAQDEGDEQPEQRTHIQVLHDPHDIASFYRSSQGQEFSPLEPSALDSSALAGSRYPIASFYRNEGNRGLYGYSRFWTHGYGFQAASPLRGGLPYRRYGWYGRRIGQNGDIFLMAPTFLAPIGPLTGVFLER